MKKISEAASWIKDHCQRSGESPFQLGVILGSGLGDFGSRLENPTILRYEDIPGFKPCGVEGHQGNLIIGEVAGQTLLCQQGRYHYYEGHSMSDVVFPVRVMAALGIKNLLVTNASGACNREYAGGDIMLIEDHINFMGTNPLIGKNLTEMGPRFPDMTYAYSPQFRRDFERVAAENQVQIRKGVYLAVTGPSYETPTEIRMFQTLGADVVGMSTVPECIAANHCGMKVLGLSCVSNAAAGLSDATLSHDEVKDVIGKMSRTFERLVTQWIHTLKPC
ncbi:MAG: purine-nucleoside phosphorylase [Acidobacteria bacterium]|nr:MAG: purine-nucleoside phosphorylase [Acidobacteriota bacterium]